VLMAGYVGVAPGSTTFYVPYATPSELKGNLGVVLNQDRYRVAPREPMGLAGPLGVVLNQDRFFVVPREPMPEYSTGLRTAGMTGALGLSVMATPPGEGGYPTDREMASTYGYLPIANSWHSRAWPWRTTDGRKVGLGNPAAVLAQAAAGGPLDSETFEQLVRVQKKQANLQLISTVAITTLAVVALVGVVAGKGH